MFHPFSFMIHPLSVLYRSTPQLPQLKQRLPELGFSAETGLSETLLVPGFTLSSIVNKQVEGYKGYTDNMVVMGDIVEMGDKVILAPRVVYR